MDIYEFCPQIENEKYRLRLVSEEDCGDLLKVYSDKAAVAFFNSDNCDGDDFYFTTPERMKQALDFWIRSYNEKWFVRLSVIDKKTSSVIGTIEIFKRDAEDYFTDCGLLRLDLASAYEKREFISGIVSLTVKPFFEWFGCSMIATKAIPEAAERIKALEQCGFALSEEKLIGSNDHKEYGNYYVLKKGDMKI